MKIRTALQEATNHCRGQGWAFCQMKAGKKNKCGLLLLNPSTVRQTFPEYLRPLQRPIVERLQMCAENLTGELPSEEAF